MTEYLSKKELAGRLGVSYRTVTDWMIEKRVSYITLGGVIRFEWSQVLRDLDRQTIKAEAHKEVA